MRALIFLFLFVVSGAVAASAQTELRALDARNQSLLEFKRDQIAIWENAVARAGAYVPYQWENALRKTRARTDKIQRTEGDAASVPFTLFQERAYFARNDGSAQPYYVALPFGYTPSKKYPLVVFLHGYSPDLSKINPWIPSDEFVKSAQKRGFIVAMPYGRRNSDFVQWGQDDVMRVRAECLRLFSIDQNRVFLLGVSMGAYGAYAAGFHTIGNWTAIAAISGRTDFYLWFDTKRADLPPWKRVLFDADDPRTLLLNARNTPIFVQHGALDGTVPVEHSRRLNADALKLGLPLRYDEDPQGSHFGSFQFEAMIRALDWFDKRASVPTPRALTVIAGDLREARGRWAAIEAFADYAKVARLDVNLTSDKMIVKTDNVASFSLQIPPEFKAAAQLPLEVDGAIVGQFATNAPIIWNAPAAKLGKTPELTGPFKSSMRDPFLLVYGDASDQRAAQNFADRWQNWADGAARIKGADEVTEQDKADFNLILFGTRATNPILAQISDDLPLELVPNGYRIGDKTVETKYIGLLMVYPSPWDKSRLIGVCSGENWGAGLPLNHIWDLVPDYIIYDYRTENDGTNRPIEAGFFDGNWALPKIEAP